MSNKGAAILAAIVSLLVAGTISAAALVLPTVDVPTCTYPTGTMSESKHAAYNRCRFDRLEAMHVNDHPTATVTVTETVTSSPTSTPTATPTATPTGVPVVADFPTRSSVGPAVTPTDVYAGPCTVTQDGLVIDGKVVNCSSQGFVIDATGVVIRNSVVNGGVYTTFRETSAAADNDTHPTVFTIEKSRVIGSTSSSYDGRALGWAHYVVRDSYVEGSHSGLIAHNQVTLTGNYITTDGTNPHQSGLRALKNATLRGNTIVCKPSSAGYDGGCSGAAVFYSERVDGTPAAAFNLTIERNYFKRDVTPGGAAGGPWFATRFVDCDNRNDCTNIKATWNLFDLDWGTDGGEHPEAAAGSVWADNYWTDGTTAESNESR